MQQLHCSFEALRIRPCDSLPVAALELLERQGAEVCDSREPGECGGSGTSSRQAHAAVYRRRALLFARSALKDSMEVHFGPMTVTYAA